MIYILYNPHSGQKQNWTNEKLLNLENQFKGKLYDITTIKSYLEFCSTMCEDDAIIICGGDGTINQFVNRTKDIDIKADILYFSNGSGNDFARDLNHEKADKPFSIKPYLKDLPIVEVKGKTYHFLNNVGFGIDGYCCEQGDIQKAKGKTAINYTAIAITGLLFHFKPRNAKISVDGVTSEYRKVWLAPTMKGRYYGGGMMPTPKQDRSNPDKSLSILLYHNAGKLKALMVFPKIFKGEHVKHANMVTIKTGHEITVTFDRPTPLQIDGETILDVTTYTAKA